jgi:hypothetical protein
MGVKKVTVSLPLDVSDDADLVTVTANDFPNGQLIGAALVVPDLTGSAALTSTLTLKDQDGVTIYSKATIAENGTTTEFFGDDPLPVVPKYDSTIAKDAMTVSWTLSGNESTDRTATAYFWVLA